MFTNKLKSEEIKVLDMVVDMVVNTIHEEFPNDASARLRIYETLAENLAGMARVLGPNKNEHGLVIEGES